MHSEISDLDLFTLTFLAAKKEKEATLALLEYLVEVDVRRLYATKAYSSLFDYIVKDLGLSEPAAAERVNAVRLMQEVPDVKTHLEEGRLSLTTASQIERFIKTENKVRDDRVQVSEKVAIIDACLNQSKREVEKTLLEKQSDEAKILTREKIKPIASDRMELKLSIDLQTFQKLEKLKELSGETSLERIFDEGLGLLLLKEQKKRGHDSKPTKPTKSARPAESKNADKSVRRAQSEKPNGPKKADEPKKTETKVTDSNSINLNSTNSNSRFIPIDLKRAIFKRSGGQCEFTDPKTKRRCKCRYRVQIDHVFPYALGGKTEPNNLRHLCQTHNLHAAKGWGLSRPNSNGTDSKSTPSPHLH